MLFLCGCYESELFGSFTDWQPERLAWWIPERYLPECIENCKIWWRRNNGLGLFFVVQAKPLNSIEGKS